MTVGKTMVHVKQALDAIYRAQLELDGTGECTDKTLDEAFEHVIGSKVKLERWIKENKA
tara:strand:- start:107 stop:283 length:177 start_codon:yes stop_codon:yes gene_type:complete